LKNKQWDTARGNKITLTRVDITDESPIIAPVADPAVSTAV